MSKDHKAKTVEELYEEFRCILISEKYELDSLREELTDALRSITKAVGEIDKRNAVLSLTRDRAYETEQTLKDDDADKLF